MPPVILTAPYMTHTTSLINANITREKKACGCAPFTPTSKEGIEIVHAPMLSPCRHFRNRRRGRRPSMISALFVPQAVFLPRIH